MQKNQIKTKWLTFYLIILVARAIINILYALPYLLDGSKNTLIFFACLPEIIVNFYLESQIQKRSAIGYRVNMIVLKILPFYIVLSLLLPTLISGVFDIYNFIFAVLLALVYFLCWSLPNIVYFKKRKSLFQDNQIETVKKKDNNDDLKYLM